MAAIILVKSAAQIIADAKGLMKDRKDDGPELKSTFPIELIFTGWWGPGHSRPPTHCSCESEMESPERLTYATSINL